MTTDFKVRSLSTIFISYDRLSKDWKTYNKDPERNIQRFISINKRSFDFLGVNASFCVRNYKCGLLLETSQFVGASSLRSPITGQPFYDLSITPVYNEDLGNIILLLGDTLNIEYGNDKLLKPGEFRVPIYFACIEYMLAFNEALRFPWTKFERRIDFENTPSNSTDWNKYVIESISPERKLFFANVHSYHTQYHQQWLQLTALLQQVLNTYISSNPPASIRSNNESLVGRLQDYLRLNPKKNTTNIISDSPSDPLAIRSLKVAARNFIDQHHQNTKAWRIEISVLFERFVQYVIKEACQRSGWRCKCNEHFVINNPNGLSWMLRYLEPDIVLTQGNDQWIIDAKYKSHVYNSRIYNAEQLKETFRGDYHQVLAYTAFATTPNRKSMIVYPSGTFTLQKITARSQISMVTVDTYIIGLPFETTNIQASIQSIADLLTGN